MGQSRVCKPYSDSWQICNFNVSWNAWFIDWRKIVLATMESKIDLRIEFNNLDSVTKSIEKAGYRSSTIPTEGMTLIV